MDEKEALIALNMINGIGSLRLKELLSTFGSAKEVFKQNILKLEKVKGLGEKIASDIKNFPFKKLIQELSLTKKNKISIITIHDESYPKLLSQIYDPPPVLYIKGKIYFDLSPSIAIVGSRRASFYGLEMAEKFSYQLALREIIVVSGMARGIDTSAHRGALKAKGKTVAVLGSGLLNIYPPENKALFENIVEDGAVISEFPLLSSPHRENFPRRNRIISGLCLGVLVVEANEKSGALITANLAMEQGREVFAIPGKISSPTSSGTNRLIKEGAKLVESIEDILEELNLDKKVILQNIEEKLTNLEKNIYEILEEPKYIDEILNQIDIPFSQLDNILLNLQLKGIIKEYPGKIYSKR
jgi:DNA processing protein